MRALAADMGELVDTVRRDVPEVFESDNYRERIETTTQDIQAKRQEMTETLRKDGHRGGIHPEVLARRNYAAEP